MENTFKSIITCFTAIAMAPAVQAMDTYNLKTTDDTTIQVIEYTQNDAKNDYDKIKKMAETIADINFNNEHWNLVSKSLEQYGLPELDSFAIGQGISSRFNLSSTSLDFTSLHFGRGPAAFPWDQDNKFRAPKDNQNMCVIINVDKGAYSIKDWVEAESERNLKPDIKLPEIYSDMKYDMVRFHEQAHCFGMDEREADFIGALQLIRKYGQDYQTEVTGFIKLHKAMRYYHLGKYMLPTHAMAGTYAEMAIDYWQQNKATLKTEEHIWDIAYKKQIPDSGITSDNIMTIGEAQIKIANKVIEGMTDAPKKSAAIKPS